MREWLNNFSRDEWVKSWKFEMSSTHIACLRILLAPTRENTPRRRDVKRDRRLIFQHAKKQLEFILYVTCLKCRDIPEFSKKHVSSNQTENISNESCSNSVSEWLFKAYTNPHSALKIHDGRAESLDLDELFVSHSSWTVPLLIQ
jgi:hypothetical protein